MADQNPADPPAPLRIGSLFSGYGGLDIAVEEVFGAETIWFSEIDESASRVFSHHWPDAPNLGDITAIDWGIVPRVDTPCGGFPCQDVSTVGKMAGLKPGTRSGLWAHMDIAIEALQPEWVVIENVRRLLSAIAVRTNPGGDDNEQRSPKVAIDRGMERDPWHVGASAPRPLRAAGAVLEDLVDLRYDPQWPGLPASAIGAPHPRYRVFILAHRTPPNPVGIRRIARRGEPSEGQSETSDNRPESSDHRPRPAWTRRLPEAGRPVEAQHFFAATRGVRQWRAPTSGRREHPRAIARSIVPVIARSGVKCTG